MFSGSDAYRLIARHAKAARSLATGLLVLFLCTSVIAQAPSNAPSDKAALLTSIRQIRHLTPEQLEKRPEIHIRGVVTYYDSIVPNLFVQDAVGGIWVDLRNVNTSAPHIGQVLDLHGVAAAGFAPYIASPKWNVIGSSKPPDPIHVSYDETTTGTFDSDWVQMEGVVRSFVKEAEGNVLVIDVATPTGSFKVRVPNYQGEFPMYLVDAKVRFRGVCGTAFNRRDQLVGIHLFMPTLENSEVVEAAPLDPFGVPVTPIAKIGKFSADLSDIRRVKVVGIVTAQFFRRGLFLMDGTGGLYAQSQDGSPLEPGDEVAVIGFPAAGNYTPVLKSGSIRPTGKHQQITPANISGQMALKGGYDAQLVKISGTVRGHRQHGEMYDSVIESDDHVAFEATIRGQNGEGWLPSVGSKVALTGICSLRTDENGNPSEFQIILRTPDDIRVVAFPPWLTARRALLLACVLTLLMLVIAAWLFILRRRVRQQTEIIKVKLENEAALEERYRRIFERNLTGLYVAKPDGSIIDCNDACAHILGFSGREDLLEHRHEAERIAKMFYAGEANSSSGATQIINAEHRFERRDGSPGWVLSNARLVQRKNDAESLVEGALVTLRTVRLLRSRSNFSRITIR
ncbi:MAG TPA: PAS domain S-box protein [Terriglobales bacterium]|nr:PAS domain S-box protein [Terriglobales bacterium]